MEQLKTFLRIFTRGFRFRASVEPHVENGAPMNWGKLIVLYGDFAAVALLLLGCIALWMAWRSQRRLHRWFLCIGANLLMFPAVWWFFAAPGHLRPIRTSYEAENRKAPDLVFLRVKDGTTGRISEFQGKLLVVNLWSTWCVPCRREMPALDRLQRDYENKGLVVLALSDQILQEIQTFEPLKQMRIVSGQVNPARAPKELFVPTDVARPITHIIDRNGILRETLLGEQTYDSLTARIRKYL